MRFFFKAWMIGIALLVLVHIAWFSILKMHMDIGFVRYGFGAAVVVCSLAGALVTPKKNILVGMSLAIPAALISAASNFVYELLGNAVDFPGMKYSLMLGLIALPWHLLLCTLGGVIAHFMTQPIKLE